MNQGFKAILVLLLILLCQQIQIYPQVNSWENYISGGKKFTCLAEDNNYVWAGTDIGLIRVNKKTEEVFIYDKTKGLPSDNITAIAVDHRWKYLDWH